MSNFRFFVNWAPGQKSDIVIRIVNPNLYNSRSQGHAT